MKMPKYIQKLLIDKVKYAERLRETEVALDEWMEKQGIDIFCKELDGCTCSGIMIYCEPINAYKTVKEYIEKFDKKSN